MIDRVGGDTCSFAAPEPPRAPLCADGEGNNQTAGGDPRQRGLLTLVFAWRRGTFHFCSATAADARLASNKLYIFIHWLTNLPLVACLSMHEWTH